MSESTEELKSRIAELEAVVRQELPAIRSDFLYTPGEVALLLRCGKTNVYELMIRGDLASTKVGAGNKGLRIRGADITAFLDSRTGGGPAPQMSFKRLKLRD